METKGIQVGYEIEVAAQIVKFHYVEFDDQYFT